MDIIVYNYYKLNLNIDMSFYWFNKNRTFNLLHKDYKREGDNAIHTLNAIIPGSYNIRLKSNNIKDISIGIRVKDNVLYKETSGNIYFKIEKDTEFKITKLDKQVFIKKVSNLKKGLNLSARKCWNLYWNSLHWLSFNYPISPSDEDKKQILQLTTKMTKNGLSCPICTRHFILWNKQNPIKNNYNSRDDLIKWYINLHNDVNKKKNKNVLTIEQVKEIYKDFDYTVLTDKYNIDILELFKHKHLVDFPDKINTTTKRILWNEYNVDF